MKENTRVLWLVRHAKTEGHGEKPDHLRELTSRGQRDCRMMGEMLGEFSDRPTVYISSTAVRALQTSQSLAEITGGNLVEEETLYSASVGMVVEIVEEASAELHSIALVGHNPTISQSVYAITGSQLVSLPTLGIAKIVIDGDWQNLENARLVELYKPR